MKLSIYCPEKKLFEGTDVQEVSLTTTEGQIQVLPGHADMLGGLDTGTFAYRTSGGDEVRGVISYGFFEIKDDHIKVMAETLELDREIDRDRALRAQKKAEEMLQSAALDEHAFNKYQLKLQRALIRQQTIR